MDLREIIRSVTTYNFHAHTQWCDGHNTLEEIALAAADKGFTHFGFSPHSPVPVDSPCNMSEMNLPAYFDEIKRVRKLLEHRMKVYCGVEIDYLGDYWGPSNPLFADERFDFSIGSVHFVPTQEGVPVDIDGRFDSFKMRMAENFHNDIRYVVGKYYEQSHLMLEKGGFTILGHFDKIAHNASCFMPGIEDQQWYKSMIGDYIDHIVESGVIVEINTKAREQYGRFFPHERYWERLIKAGVDIAVNSDAHYCDRVDASRAEAFALLNRI